MATRVVAISELYIDYDLTEIERNLLASIVGEVPFPAHLDPLSELARKFLATEDLKDTVRYRYLSEIGDTKLLYQDIRSFEGLVHLEVEEFWPITCNLTPCIKLREPITWHMTVVNGGHRIAFAIARGYKFLRATIKEPLAIEEVHIYGHDRPYQTLIFPTGKVEGMRGNERWELFRPEDIKGKQILDLGCSSGVDGILTLLCGAEHYHGIEYHVPSVGYGVEMARAWGLSDRARLVAGDVGVVNIPRADTMFLFSVAQRIPLETLAGAVVTARPEVIYLETHVCGDPVSADLMNRLDFQWESLGTVPQSVLSPRWREIYKGTR